MSESDPTSSEKSSPQLRHRGVFTARELTGMFRNGLSTAEIANILLVPEASVANVLALAREVERLYGNDHFAPTAKRKSLMEGFENWWDVPQPPIRKMAKVSGLGGIGTGQGPEDQGSIQDDPAGGEPDET